MLPATSSYNLLNRMHRIYTGSKSSSTTHFDSPSGAAVVSVLKTIRWCRAADRGSKEREKMWV